MNIGTAITIAVILFTAGGSYTLISWQLKENTKKISTLMLNTSGLKAYMEQQLANGTERMDAMQDMIKKHDDILKLMGFHTIEAAKRYSNRNTPHEE